MLDGVELRLITADPASDHGSHWLVLDEFERNRAARFRFDQDRRLYVAAWSGVRSVLASTLGVTPDKVEIRRRCSTCGANDHGQPYLPGSPYRFSISRSGSVVLIGLHRERAIGVDVELLSRAGLVDEAMLHPAEVDALRNSEERERTMLRAWVRKEAVLKALGVGLTWAPESVQVVGPPENGPISVELRGWRLTLVDADVNLAFGAVATVDRSIDGTPG